jgi:quinoprotein glucose dehydrogenase
VTTKKRAPSPAYRSGGLSLTLFALVLATGCGPRETRPLDIVTLSPEAAIQRADSIRQTVTVELADGLELSLWASEQLVADPIALAMDDQGGAWFTRTIRQKHSEFDIRGFQEWMIPSIGLQTVEDRRRFLRDTFAPEKSAVNEWLVDLNGDGSHDWHDLTVEMERAYRVQDTSGDGTADRAQLYIEDFHDEVTDIAGAVLPVGKDVYLGVAPDMWRLTDSSGDGMADEQTAISHGYGVHIGFGGHNISGLTMGPDGRLYWSIGDIGFDVVGPDGQRWAYPNQGAIFRSELDGSGFEVFAAGVRNTHEFVFDKYGNLISVDNDGDHAGEHERIVYLVNGSDSGWRSNWQYGKYTDPDNNQYKVWMDEGLFQPRFEGQAAYILPPVASYHSGPAGMAYSPGTALNGAWRDRFFIAEFTGSPARSRIFAFQLEPLGAGFAFAGEEVVSRGILTTGLDFGPDGALYVADWIEGWETKDRGRIWKLDIPGAAASPERVDTKALLAENMAGRNKNDLMSLLAHADMRVRMKAQFELAARGEAEALLSVARQTDHQLARLHGLWGIGQLARRDASAAEPLVAFLRDGDAEIRSQASKVLGDVRYAPAAEALLPLLQDTSARARFFAAEALGRLAHGPAVEHILDMLEANNDEDVYLRHGGAIALARIGNKDALTAVADHPSRALRTVAVVALRRLRDPGVARFLEDEDDFVVTEAARAINDDESIEAALPSLAGVLGARPDASEPLVRRALNANLRVGAPENAQAVAAFASRSDVTEAMRVEAISILGVWPAPSLVDRVDGVHRGALARETAVARAAIAPIIEALLTQGTPAIKAVAAQTVGRLGLESALPALLTLLRQDPSTQVRQAALQGLNAAGSGDIDEAVQLAMTDGNRLVRMTALGIIPSLPLSQERVAELLASAVKGGRVEEQQAALEALGTIGSGPAQEVLASLLTQLESGGMNPAVQLDLLEAVASGGGGALVERLEAYRSRNASDSTVTPTGAELLASYGETLQGGNAGRGRRVVNEHPAAQCIRCHAIGDRGGDVGPPLTDVGARLSREELLAALVAPSMRIAEGFGEAPSAMPPMGLVLQRREIRDVIAFLATLEGN